MLELNQSELDKTKNSRPQISSMYCLNMNRSFAVLFLVFFLLHSSCFYSRIWEALCLLVPAEIRPILFYTKQMGSVCRQLLSQHIYKYQQSSAWMWISRSCSSDPNPELRNHEGAQQKLKSSFSSGHDRYLWTPGFSREVDARLGQLKVGCTARHSFSILRLSNQISQHNRTLPTFAVHSHLLCGRSGEAENYEGVWEPLKWEKNEAVC